MGIFDKIIRCFRDDDTNEDSLTAITETKFEKSFNPVAKNGGRVKQKIDGSFNTTIYNAPVTYVDGSILPVHHGLIKARKGEIKALMDDGLTAEALDAYLRLQTNLIGEALSVDDKFYLLNGIYNCKVNLHVEEVELETLKVKLELLSDATDYHKFIYLTAIRKFNSQDIEATIRLCNEANTIKEDYVKSKVLRIIAQGINEEIKYEDGLTQLEAFREVYTDDTRELSNVVCAKGDLSYSLGHYDDAIVFYTEANAIHPMTHFQLGIAMSYFYKATSKSTDKGYITFDKLDFDALYEAVKVFEEILEIMKTKKDVSTLTRMMPYYLNALEMIDEPQKVIELSMNTEYIDGLESQELAKLKANAEVKLGKKPTDISSELNPTEQLKVEVTWLMHHGKYGKVVEKLHGVIDSIFKGDEQMLAFYLIALGKSDNALFSSEFEKYSEGREDEVKFRLIWIQHLEHIGGIEEAERKLSALLEENPNNIVIGDAYRFFKRHGFVDKAFEITTAVMENKFSVLRTDLSEFIKTHFFTILESKDYRELDRFFNQIDFSILSDKDRLQIEIEYLVTKGEVFLIADKCIEYSEITGDYKTAMKGASFYLKGGNLDKGIEILLDLISEKKVCTADVHIQLAQAYVLKGKYDDAFEMALKAKEIDQDHYKSESHRFFVSLSLRVNRVDESAKYMGEYHQEFPKNNWIKSVRIIKTDDEGNEVLDRSELDALLGNGEAYNAFRERFFSYEIGLSTYMKILKDNKLNFIFNELRHRGKKIKIATGQVAQVNESATIIDNTIIVDSISLFVMIESGIIGLLEKFENVYVLFSTIEAIQDSLLMNECKILRKALDFIHNASNVKVVPIHSSILEDEEAFLTETSHCLCYSYENSIPYLAMDFNLKNFKSEKSEFVVDIIAVSRGLCLKDLENRAEYSKYNNCLLKGNYMFISFNAFEMYDSIINLESFDDLEEELSYYFCMSRFCDYSSYIKVYNMFLMIIEQKVDREIYLRCVVAMFQYLNRYLGKTQYYYNNLLKIIDDVNIKEPFFKSNNIVNEFMNYSNYVDEREGQRFYDALKKDYNFVKLDAIITSIINGLFSFFGRYKNKPEEFKILWDLMNTHMSNIDRQFAEILLSEMKKINEETA
ncbi:tetratricopeptide repeat protein [Vallitalea guaymasensis]|uniref:Tetratricopeptide repeat protein n=1 Tax=Vallitalea guaymasensis TaxID=1185412 RepID=A0A8J8MED2_9FIRM|nr:hypothetical protein [Vallitalea guaymasensis]QUH31140.1 hypothetical protein HYG85_20330 [Vallitalea guaymasensis]